MNTISKSHKLFSERLRNSRVLEYPEEFLGENFEAVLNFWLILDDLSGEQLKIVKERYVAFHDESDLEWDEAIDLAFDASNEVVGEDYAYHAVWTVLNDTNSWAAGWATDELIGMHKILEEYQQPLTFFPMILEVL